MAGEAENSDERDAEKTPRSRDRYPGRGAPGRPRRPGRSGGADQRRREGDAPGRPGREGSQRRHENRRGGDDRGRPGRQGRRSDRGWNDRRQQDSGRGPDRAAGEGGHRRPLPRGESRPPQADRPTDPPIYEDVTFAQLDRQARQRLRTLSKESAERVGRHLVMAGLLVEEDPELAYQHAHSALRRAGRVDVVREAVALTAYATGRYAEALREIRTVRRLSGLDALRAIEADCERGLGRPERALDLAAAPPSKDMTTTDRVELALVASGARLDLGQPDAALLLLDQPLVLDVADEEMRIRVAQARVTALQAAGRTEEAEALEATIPPPEPEEDEVVFAVLHPEELAHREPATAGEHPDSPTASSTADPQRAADPREDDSTDV